ncbi:protein-glutamate methylesterase/protein-glutamine glutaminase [Paenibacillus radicis (ex Xue et al. 2023)]|uniref:Protein-glutamate methylesterase/protein-glutamine glutaminase n=1 Tax=Paenibacillus radicis (ex Xue et al. 2023) TaxID=2972489 RepID=A0ABT1YEZ3_9BACL|nr:chemotaxis response regulator protein-glutamate methylesterase [Paenibacillus radicis (ex Xue et al. 2023)]MCR8630793.1 chemotaxis response regulator protein-glutamate methylesterase [Paenibacillus radicis (ex Xue et al. 2023)]
MKPYGVLVVDDSVFMRKIITDLITEDPQFQVIATAKNGKEAVELVKKLKPNVVTMDIEMPEMNGLDALKAIMSEQPTPVVMLSSLTQDGARETITALERGAVDFIGKPSGSISLDLHKVKTALLEKLHIAVKTNVNKFQLNPLVAKPSPRVAPVSETVVQSISEKQQQLKPSSHVSHLVAIGTSTGGPRALHQVISQIPGHIPAPIVIVQHMPPNFTKSLAQRLDSVSELKVVEAENGMILQNGTAYVAPGSYHMTIARNGPGMYKIHLNQEEPRGGHRPSVDVLFESILPLKELKRHIVLMTGMGADGAKGMLALKQAGAVTTIAESEETCIVYGMPRAAVELNCVMHVLPQQEIARKISHAVITNTN